MSPILENYLGLLLLGGIMGVIGQGVRTIVGIKKMFDQTESQNVSDYDLFMASRLFVSLFIGFIAGAAAALTSIKADTQSLSSLSPAVLMGLAMAGYAGADFIEGFASRFTSAGSGSLLQRAMRRRASAATGEAVAPKTSVAPTTHVEDRTISVAPTTRVEDRTISVAPTTHVEDRATAAFDQNVVDACANFTLGSSADLDSLFAGQGGFFAWYNSALSSTSAFVHRGRALNNVTINQNFKQFWDQIPSTFGRPQISMIEFCALMSVSIQETTGNLTAAPEEMNGPNRPHPGLAYAFDKIPGLKQSYNVSPNKNAFELFKDFYFLKQHASLTGSAAILNNPGGIDTAWSGQVWPDSYPSTTVNPSVNGFVMEADFYKFRGRGVIQTTWRSDYKLMIAFILSSAAARNSTLAALANQWIAATPNLSGDSQLDAIATISTNADWDRAFAEPLTLAAGVSVDNDAKGNYLSLSRDATILLADKRTRGSLLYMAAKINGGTYPTTVAPMMQAMMSAVSVLLRPAVVAMRREPRWVDA